MKKPVILKFIQSVSRNPSNQISNIERDIDFYSIPESSGAYLILSSKEEFIYPSGKSRVIYIGMSTNLRRSIKNHVKNFDELKGIPKNKRKNFWYYSRYNYMVKFGCRIIWYTTKGTETPKSLESKLIEDFYSQFHSLPIGNGAFSY
ncbi:MAG: hypothetical protein B7Z16_02550 [Algoriphagus sp. 32-45-6]|nr:MAG: hypothetical protein B7Z16_02550 [Algoriphagus sp. 32-45-6]